MGTLYLVATPIGNLEDISPRAIRVLDEVRLIAAEDTRVTRKMLNYFNLHTPLTSYYEHNKLKKSHEILVALDQGDVALVSDAGTPGINDPGVELVQAVLAAGHQVSPVPGPSALTAALTASGLPTSMFLYLGYLPRKSSERRRLCKQIADLTCTLIFLEAPHRLCTALEDLETELGDRQICVAREMTKMHEQFWRGPISGARTFFSHTEPRGEFTLVVAGKAESETQQWSEQDVLDEISRGLVAREPPSPLARRIARQSGWDRSAVYDLIKGQK